MHDRDGLPDPDSPFYFGELLRRSHPTVDSPTYRKLSGLPDERPTGEMAVPLDEWDPRVPGALGMNDPHRPKSGAILAWGCLALLLAAGVVVWWLR